MSRECKLISLEGYLETRFADHPDAPSLAELRRWCRQGKLPAKKLGKRWWVNVAKEDILIVENFLPPDPEAYEALRDPGHP